MTRQKDNPKRNAVLEYPLVCGHSILFTIAPRPADQLFCFKCDAYTTVALRTNEWTVECDVCTYIRYFGSDAIKTKAKATAHAKRNEHPTHAFYNGAYRYTVGKIVGIVIDETNPASNAGSSLRVTHSNV